MPEWIKSRIRTIPDYPIKGIMFRDVTTLMQDAQGFRKAVDEMVYGFAGQSIDKVVGIDARGFILGGAVAHQLSVGFVPVRKAGKLPSDTHSQTYSLEYGVDELQIHTDGIAPGERVLLIDDLIATGGSAEAAIKLITRCGGDLVGCSFVISLPELGGVQKVQDMGYSVHSLCEYEGH
jgi:adenine phosphoribosyltransferase